MGRQARKIKRSIHNNIAVEQLGGNAVRYTPIDKTGPDVKANLNSFFVDGKPFIKLSDLMRCIGPTAVSKGACSVVESVGFKRGKDYYVTPLGGLPGVHAVCSYEKGRELLEKLSIPLSMPGLYDWYNKSMKNDIDTLSSTVPKEALYLMHIKDGKIVTTIETENKSGTKNKDKSNTYHWIENQFTSLHKENQELKKELEELHRDIRVLLNELK